MAATRGCETRGFEMLLVLRRKLHSMNDWGTNCHHDTDFHVIRDQFIHLQVSLT